MKTLLICPEPQTAVRALSEKLPLAALPLLGSSVVESWLVHLAVRGCQQIVIYANDRVEMIHSIVGSGRRWGLQVDVVWVPGEQIDSAELGRPLIPFGDQKRTFDCIEVMDRLPGQPNTHIFATYANWFRAVQDRLPDALTLYRIGMREVSTGIFVGQDSRISASAQLSAPCWIGNQVVVGPSVVIGPETVVENRSIIKKGAHILKSIIGPDTLVGSDTEIKDSLVSGERLINWSNGSSIHVTDVFLLSSLHARPAEGDARMPALVSQATDKTSEAHFQKYTYTSVAENESIVI